MEHDHEVIPGCFYVGCAACIADVRAREAAADPPGELPFVVPDDQPSLFEG